MSSRGTAGVSKLLPLWTGAPSVQGQRGASRPSPSSEGRSKNRATQVSLNVAMVPRDLLPPGVLRCCDGTRTRWVRFDGDVFYSVAQVRSIL